jgi:hypothetical protein
MKLDFISKWSHKARKKAILISDEADFKLKLMKGDKESHFILINGTI